MKSNRKSRFVDIHTLNDERISISVDEQSKNDMAFIKFCIKTSMFVMREGWVELKPLLCDYKQTGDEMKPTQSEDTWKQRYDKLMKSIMKENRSGNTLTRNQEKFHVNEKKQRQLVKNHTRNERRLTMYVYKPSFRQNKIKN